ncbi:MAG: class I SAM-dependent rRNA methyltransferase, partial [Cyclobacteriaceae bacterium]|nr:class I SAM-dependent rRNA methyltransferase [Cyclobacteriaceae bacterium]
GHYQEGSISVRILTFRQQKIDHNFWTEKIRKAFILRKTLGLACSDQTTGYRLVFGEGDGLPGLVIDWYDGAAIIQAHSAGMQRSKDIIAEALQHVYEDRVHTIYFTPAYRKGDQEEGFMKGDVAGTWFKENGLFFYAQWQGGQKTGFFLDQRENRKLLHNFVKDKVVLDAFSHAGGFAVNALAGGARKVVVLDASKKAIQIAENNFRKNGFAAFETQVGDTLEYLNKNDQQYDVMVIDPPAYAKHVSSKHKAVQGYKRLNIKAMQRICPDGILFTFSCSQVVDKALFENTIRAAAIESKRKIRILHWLSQPADHPVDIFHPESTYLKGLVLAVY